MGTQRLDQLARQHRHPVLAALAVAHQQLGALEIHVFDAQPHHLHQPHTAAVEQARHQRMRALHPFQHGGHLAGREHHRQPGRALGAHHVLHPRQVLPQHLAVQKQQGRQRLVLRRSRHMALHRQMRQKSLHLRRPHPGRMALAMKQDEALGPVNILGLGAYAVMAQTDALPQQVQQLRRCGACGSRAKHQNGCCFWSHTWGGG